MMFKRKESWLAATLLVGVSYPAIAGITCTMQDQKGNNMTYNFGRGGDGYADEMRVMRNGTVISNGGPIWTRVVIKKDKSTTLWSPEGWNINYWWDSTKGEAVLLHNGNKMATGQCVADYSFDAHNAPSPEFDPPYQYKQPDTTLPQYTPPQPNYTSPLDISGDSVPITVDGDKAFVTVQFGGWEAEMLIDTGANVMNIGTALAHNLVQHGLAHYSGNTAQSTIADGSIVTQDILIIDKVTVGNHTVYDVQATVAPGDNPMLLLPFQIITQMGKVTIDKKNSTMTLG